MNIYDLNTLISDEDGLFNLDQRTFNYSLSIPFTQYVVDRSEEMRIDLVSRSIYQSVNYVGFLMYFNNIDNPMNIKSGDVINYISLDQISSFQVSQDENTSQDFLNNLNRDTIVDSNRIDYLNQSNNPTFNTRPVEQVVDRKGVIIIGNKE